MIGETSYAGSGSMLKPTHYVNPHWVNSYVKRDGTFVRGFWRDGDGDTTIDRTIGYFAGNPRSHMVPIFDNPLVEGGSALKDTLQIMLGYYTAVGGLWAAMEIKDRLGEARKIVPERYKNIRTEAIAKSYFLGGKRIIFRIENALTGELKGKRELLDVIQVENMLEEISAAIWRTTSKYNPIPDEIIIRNVNAVVSDSQPQEPTSEPEPQIIESWKPRYTLEQVALNKKIRQQINTAISAIKYKKKLTEEWGLSELFSGNRAIILNFYGKAGTGKSMTAEAVAQALGKRVYRISYAELESKYVGETPKNIRRAFELATKDDAVLIFDEADSFLGKRLTSVTQSADYGVNITRSVLLMELEKFAGVVVFTTNLISNYDEAFKRRILLNIYFELPDLQARECIWKLHIGSKMPLGDITPESLAERYEDVSGADIKDMVFYAALYTLEEEKETMDFSVFDYAYSVIQERYRDKDKESGFRVVSTVTEKITEEQYQREVSGHSDH